MRCQGSRGFDREQPGEPVCRRAEVKGAAADLEKAVRQMEESETTGRSERGSLQKESDRKESRDQSVTEYAVTRSTYESSKEKAECRRSRRTAAAGQLDAAVSQRNASRPCGKEAEANRAFFRSKLDDTSIVTPVNGTVISRRSKRARWSARGDRSYDRRPGQPLRKGRHRRNENRQGGPEPQGFRQGGRSARKTSRGDIGDRTLRRVRDPEDVSGAGKISDISG